MRVFVFFFLISSFSIAQPRLIDDRDGSEYQITKLETLYWMAENLRYDAEGSVCQKDCDQIRFYDYRYLDNVCPEGWRLPIMQEWDALIRSFEDAETARMLENKSDAYRVDFLDKYNIFESNVLNIKPYGRVEGGEQQTGTIIDFWTANPASDKRFHMHFSPYSIVGHSHKHHLKQKKPEDYRLFPVRCVCEEDNFQAAK